MTDRKSRVAYQRQIVSFPVTCYLAYFRVTYHWSLQMTSKGHFSTGAVKMWGCKSRTN